MFSHITVGTSDLERASKFYDAVMAVLGIPRNFEEAGEAVGYGVMQLSESTSETFQPEFVVTRPYDGQEMHRGNGWHAAFLAKDRATVDAFHKAALAHGGTDEGAPGLRLNYHPKYYAAYVRDPDGNKLQAVCHWPQ
ncbi:MAG: lactoylglutathione lyase [Rhizobiales bacterium NRL2]|nr:MAG: lactoylglutathione lyase [Rhizobiales bacterium NRL2]